MVMPIVRAEWFENQVHTLPAYQGDAPEGTERKGPKGGNIFWPSTIGSVANRPVVLAFFTFCNNLVGTNGGYTQK